MSILFPHCSLAGEDVATAPTEPAADVQDEGGDQDDDDNEGGEEGEESGNDDDPEIDVS